jgi:hypothetical protein
VSDSTNGPSGQDAFNAVPSAPDAATLFESLRVGLADKIDGKVASILLETLFSERKGRKEAALAEIRTRIGLPE